VKESKRQLSQSELIELVQRQGGLCHDCGHEIGTSSGPAFNAHHVIDHAAGGQTDLTNEVAVCVDCHAIRHDRQLWPQIKEFRDRCDPRYQWQVRGLFSVAKKIREGAKIVFAEVVMAAGKTLFSIVIALLVRRKRNTDTTIVVVPKNAIGDGYADEIRAFDPGASISRQLLPSASRVLDPPSDNYIIVTYAAITGRNSKNVLRAIQHWRKKGWSCSFIFDEIHHTSVVATWGTVADLEREADLSVVLSGTPFRQDEQKIAIVPYGTMGLPMADVSYTMRQGIRDRICRPVSFRFVDAQPGCPIVWYERKDDGKTVERFADNLQNVPRDIQHSVARKLLMPDRELWTPIYEHGNEHLKSIRSNPLTGMGKGLIVCEAGRDKNCNEVQLVERTANAWMRAGGASQKPIVVTCDKPDAGDLIRHFRGDVLSQWIAAINMIAEGVNIPWLMVLCLFRCITSESLFKQLVGRVMRTTTGGSDDEWGRIILPKTSFHVEFAEKIEDAVAKGTADRPVAPALAEPQSQANPGAPRVVEAFVDDACLQGGVTEGCQVLEQWIGWGKKVLEQRRRSGDEVRLGLYLATAKEMNVYGNSEVLRRSVSRSQMILNLEAEMRSFAKHSNLPSEDADLIVLRKLGISRTSEFDMFSTDDLSRARAVVRSMTVDVIRDATAV
jgi:superfamily II DNA or RNA helicase